MNLNTLAALVRPDVTTASVTFSPSNPRTYYFKILRSLADTLEPGDLLVAHCTSGFKVVCLQEVHDDPKLDPEDNIDYDWLVQAVDTDGYAELLQAETKIADKLRTQRQQSYRRQTLAAFGIDDPDQFVQELIGPAEKE